MKAKTYGSGWHKESLRHSRAKKLGKAGGQYSQAMKKIRRDEILHKKGILLEEQSGEYELKRNPDTGKKLLAYKSFENNKIYYLVQPKGIPLFHPAKLYSNLKTAEDDFNK